MVNHQLFIVNWWWFMKKWIHHPLPIIIYDILQDPLTTIIHGLFIIHWPSLSLIVLGASHHDQIQWLRCVMGPGWAAPGVLRSSDVLRLQLQPSNEVETLAAWQWKTSRPGAMPCFYGCIFGELSLVLYGLLWLWLWLVIISITVLRENCYLWLLSFWWSLSWMALVLACVPLCSPYCWMFVSHWFGFLRPLAVFPPWATALVDRDVRTWDARFAHKCL